MGCGSSTDTKKQQKPQKSQTSKKTPRLQKGVPASSRRPNNRKTGFVGVQSLDGDELEPYRNNNDKKYESGITELYGFKAKIKRHLKECTERGTLEKMEEALAIYEKYEGPHDDDYLRALKRRHFLEIQRGLRDGIRRRHAGVLDEAITNAYNSPFSNRLKSHISAAEKLRDHIWELEIHKHDVMDINQKTVSEIKSYHRPQDCLYITMKATYVLLGTKSEQIQEWEDIQMLLNQPCKESILYRIDHFDLDKANVDHALQAEKILDRTDYEDVLKASNGVAIFYLWTNQNIETIKREHKSEINKRKKK